MQPNTVTVTVFDQKYRIGRLNAITQFHVMRRLHGLAGSAGETFMSVQRMGGSAQIEKAIREKSAPDHNILEVISPILRAIGDMKDEDVNYIFDTCLGVVERRIPGDRGWAKIMPNPGVIMFDDIEMSHMLVLTWKVLQANLSNFFSDLLSELLAQGTTGSGSAS